MASTRRTFGDAHDRLWGEVLPVPTDSIVAWEPGTRGPLPRLRALPTPGHIGHHLAYLDERNGTLFAGDAMGIVLSERSPTHAPTPPPAVDLDAWQRSLEQLAGVGAEAFAVTHFGLYRDVESRRRELAERLREILTRVRQALEADDPGDALRYEEEVRAAQAEHLPRERVDRYFDVFRATNDWAGVRRYVEKTLEREEAG